MKFRELKRAEIGDRVAFRPLAGDNADYAEGTITGFSPSKHKATIEWDDGAISQINDATYDRVELLEKPIKTADLTQATAATINDLQKAFAAERLQGTSPTDRRSPTPTKGRRP